MPIRAAINGFGRIGRLVYCAIRKHHPNDIRVVAVNDVGRPEAMTYMQLLRYDTNHGCSSSGADGAPAACRPAEPDVQVLSQPNLRLLPWQALGVDVVIEATGVIRDASMAHAHIDGGAGKVIITAPAENEDLTVVLGVNEQGYDPRRHNVLSNASCTANGIAPVAKVLFDQFGIEKGILTTVHSHGGPWRLVDLETSRPRDTRMPTISTVAPTPGVAAALGRIIPELDGRFTEMALRVPASTISVIDLTVQLSRSVTVADVNVAMESYARGPMRGILAYSEEPLASVDLRGNSHSAIVSGADTLVVGGDLVKVIAWYDSEWGYCARVADLVAYVAGERRVSHGSASEPPLA